MNANRIENVLLIHGPCVRSTVRLKEAQCAARAGS